MLWSRVHCATLPVASRTYSRLSPTWKRQPQRLARSTITPTTVDAGGRAWPSARAMTLACAASIVDWIHSVGSSLGGLPSSGIWALKVSTAASAALSPLSCPPAPSATSNRR